MFLIVWYPALLHKLSAYGIQGQLHTWLTDFLYSRIQCVALNDILSSLLTVQVKASEGSVVGSMLFLIFINDLSYSLFFISKYLSGSSSLSLC